MPLSRGAADLLARLTFLSQQRGYAWPSQQWLAESFSCTRRTIKAWVHELKTAGLLQCARDTKRSYRYLPSASPGLPLNFPSASPHPLNENEATSPPTPPRGPKWVYARNRKPSRRSYHFHPVCRECGGRHATDAWCPERWKTCSYAEGAAEFARSFPGATDAEINEGLREWWAQRQGAVERRQA
jgi:biotin operon repressor